MIPDSVSFRLRLRRSAAAFLLFLSFSSWLLGLSNLANGFIGLTTGKEQWIQVANTTFIGLGAVFGAGLTGIVFGYVFGRAGLSLWRYRDA